MIDRFSFINIDWAWHVVIIAVLIWLAYAWKEKDNYGSSKFIIHLGISFVAVTSLVLMALQPQISIIKDTQVAAILTEGYNKEQLDSLKRTNQSLEIHNYEIGKSIFDLNKIPSTAFILGNGIREFDFWQLENIPSIYLGGKEMKGISELKYDYYQTIGNHVKFTGNYKNPGKNNRLLLEGPGGHTLDSLTLSEDNSQVFELSTDLNITGNLTYHLVEKDSLGTILSKDILPLTIVEKNLLKILMLNDFPTFESKYLKNFLAETGHQIIVKNQLTTGRFKYEYFNMTSRPVINISQESLETFDLLIIDTKSLRVLSKIQRATLLNTIRDLGLGMLIQPDADYFASRNVISSFNFSPEKSKEVVLEEFPKQNLMKYPYQFKDDISILPIHQSDSKIWSAFERVGSGRIGSTIFKNTFELILNGHSETYQSFWTKIIESISRQKIPTIQWSVSRNIANKDQPFEFELRTTIPNPIVQSSEGYTIPLKRDVHVKSLWEGKVYPKETGWNQHVVNQDTTETFQYYVTDSSQWKTISNFNTIKDNKNHFSFASSTESSPRTTLKLVNTLWFFVIFILCSGYLWLEPKL